MNVKAKQYADCACTKIQQDEHCIVGYPSLLCEICGGKGVVPYVKLDGPELWEIVFGIANEVAHEISDEQYTKIAEAINSVFIDTAPSPRAQALEEAAKFIDKKVSDYVQEHGATDPETGAVEFPGWGDEYVSELEELAEDIRTLSYQSVAEQSAAESDVLSERRRQVEVEGWKPEHDDQHTDFSLARAAAVYALCAAVDSSNRSVMDNFQNVDTVPHPIRKLWPWNQNWLKPTSRRRDLVKAGALIKAEIERLDRVELPIELGGGKR
ncbi:hypothetical protein F9K97_03380 [Brucella anthropi]|uniref:hypothetical protein n=1 Tax=Brucella anthropi TaxID=529 RepID=UPI00124BFA46|nr:hypothetical protein [Brucella anthropi]KAB2788159.1 hypothetical protein F9K97_03380 [Brucella anthropi]